LFSFAYPLSLSIPIPMNGHRRRLLRVVCTLLLFGCISGSAFAQGSPTSAASAGDSFINTFATPGAATITVNVWGSVARPGLWRIERGADLVEFLSVTGLAGIGQDRPGTRTKTYVAIYRTINNERRQVYRSDIEDILEDGASYPVLQDDDVLGVESVQRRSLGFQTISLIVGTASSLASLTFLILRN